MKEERRYQHRNDYYIHDNLARKTSVEEERRQKTLERIREQNAKNAKNNVRAVTRLNYGIDLFSAVVLSLALVCIFYFGLQYLTLNSKIAETNKSVSALSKTYTSMQNRNDEAYRAVEDTVSIENVYVTAVKELGMVYPGENQIVTYNYSEEGYVRQYQKLPEK